MLRSQGSYMPSDKMQIIFNPLTPTVTIGGTAIKYRVPDHVNIFDTRSTQPSIPPG